MGDVKHFKVDEPYLDTRCKLGEGPHYNARLGEFRFLDIDGRKIHFVNASKGPSSHRVIEHPDFSIGVTADIEGNDDEFIFAGEWFYGIMNKQTGKHRVLKEFWEDDEAESRKKRHRMNDGNVDSQGRFWAGTMIDPQKDSAWLYPSNVLFRLDPDLSVHRVLQGRCTCPNGTSWTYDDKTMYWTDSGTGTIYAFDYDPATGAISNERPFFRWPGEEKGIAPDGHVMDVEEHLWVAMFGTSKVVRVNPQGKIVAEIVIPAKKVTCPCFVGEELWITSIGAPDSGEYAGSLFKINVGIKGKPKAQWRGKV